MDPASPPAPPHSGCRSVRSAAITGYGVSKSRAASSSARLRTGIVRPADDDATDLASRLHSVYKGIVEVVQQYRPRSMVVEQLYSQLRDISYGDP